MPLMKCSLTHRRSSEPPPRSPGQAPGSSPCLAGSVSQRLAGLTADPHFLTAREPCTCSSFYEILHFGQKLGFTSHCLCLVLPHRDGGTRERTDAGFRGVAWNAIWEFIFSVVRPHCYKCLCYDSFCCPINPVTRGFG